MATYQLYFDFISPYAYLAHVDLQRRAAERGDEVALEPILFAALLKHHGQLGPAEIPAKRAWLIRDTLRQAQRLAVPFTFPATHPFRPLTALRVAQREVSGDKQAEIVDALFRHGWQRGGEMGDDASIIEALNDAGFDGGALVEKAKGDDAKAALRARTEEAIERGVFGVPTLIAGGELFWGCDRVDDALDHVDGKLAIQAEDLQRLLSTDASAKRTR